MGWNRSQEIGTDLIRSGAVKALRGPRVPLGASGTSPSRTFYRPRPLPPHKGGLVRESVLYEGARFYPSGRGGHKNSGNVATFSEFLGGRKNLAPSYDSCYCSIPRRVRACSRLADVPASPSSQWILGSLRNHLRCLRANCRVCRAICSSVSSRVIFPASKSITA